MYMLRWYVFTVFSVSGTWAVTPALLESLRRHVLQSYNKEIRPPLNHNNPLNISVTFQLNYIKRVDVVTGTFATEGVLYFLWNDERLVWNASNFSEIYNLTFNSKIWTPDVIVVYSVMDDIKLDINFTQTTVFSNGTVFWTALVKLNITFEPDMTYFPQDTQMLSIRLGSTEYFNDDVFLMNGSTFVDLSIYSINNEWDLLDTSTGTSTYGGRLPGIVDFDLKIKRKPKHYSVAMLSPPIILMIINPIVFLLPAESGERASLAVSMFLSYGIFIGELREHMPEVSNPMAYISYYYLIVFALSGIITIVLIINTRLYHHPDTKAVWWLKYLVNILSFKFLLHFCICRRRRRVHDTSTETIPGSEPEAVSDQHELSMESIAISLDYIAFCYFFIIILVILLHALFALAI